MSTSGSTRLFKEYKITARRPGGQTLRLKLIDSEGYGQNFDVSSWNKHIKMYIQNKLLEYINDKREAEQEPDKIKRIRLLNSIKDNRIHLVLYFFDGHHTKSIDFSMIKRLQNYANVIPIISKADSFKPNELNKIKLDIVANAYERKVNFFDCRQALLEMMGDYTSEQTHQVVKALLVG